MNSVYYDSPLGRILIASDGDGLTGLWFEGQKYYASTATDIICNTPDRHIDSAKQWLNIYFSGGKPDYTPVLSLHGTAFRMEVWKILQTIPYGETMTYGEIAAVMAKRRGSGIVSARAVGGAAGHNPVSIIVPCHRVTGSGGTLTGYAGGLERKKALLELEGIL